MSQYIGASLPDPQYAGAMAEKIMRQYSKSGEISSFTKGGSAVGYDYGLLLFNLVKLGVEGQRIVFDKMLSVLDETGAWCEYYAEDRPRGTRCRPWESAINLEAAIEYALQE